MRSFEHLVVTALAAALGTATAFAAEPYRLLNINREPAEVESSRPRHFHTVNGRVLFVADDPGVGTELFVSDGTAAGTRVLADLCPGPCSSEPIPAWVSGDHFYFQAAAAADETHDGVQIEATYFLWRTDGTAEGTIRLVELSEFLPAEPDDFVYRGKLGDLPGGRTVFVGNDREHGREPWVTDGTPSGTRLLADIEPGPGGASILREFLGSSHRPGVVAADRVVFVAWDRDHGQEPWTTDGTPQGTRLLKDILPGEGHARPTNLGSAGGLAFFSAVDEAHGRELWASDGTPGGTRLVADLTPGPEGTDFGYTRVGIHGPGDRAFFLAAAGGGVPELWTTDGTASGTRKLTSFAPRRAFPVLTPAGRLGWFRFLFTGAKALFWADDGPHGVDLWQSDGTAPGTRPFADLCPGPCDSRRAPSSSIQALAVEDGRAIAFNAEDDEHGEELWWTDGTAAGTRRIADTCPGECSGAPGELRELDGGVVFLAWDGDSFELWSSRGAEASARQLTDLGRDAFEIPRARGGRLQGAAVGDRFLFAARDPDRGYELWATDGTAAGTGLLKDLAVLLDQGSIPRDLTLLGDRIFFLANEGEDASGALWATDGTPEGTERVLPGVPPLSPLIEGSRARLMRAGERLYFLEDTSRFDKALWSMDASGTDLHRVAEIPEDGDFRADEVIRAELGGRLVFNTAEGFWMTDGGPGPATFLGSVGVPVFSRSASNRGPWIARAGGLLLLMAREDFQAPLELWRLDGTPEGTAFLAGGGTGPRIEGPPVGLADHGYFFAREGDGACGLWRSDGTSAGTREVAPLPLLPFPAPCPSRLIATTERLFFVTTSGNESRLWASDGTAAGTGVVLESLPRSIGLSTSTLQETLVFLHDDPDHGTEVWVSDGTTEGTRLLRDFRPGPRSSRPALMVVSGAHLYLTAYEEDHGRQLWRSDGTSEGTVRLTDAYPPSAFGGVELGNLFVFSASDGATGHELWALDTTDAVEPPPGPAGPPPPGGPWLTSQGIPGFRFKVRIAQGAGAFIPGAAEADCIPETLCVSGALAGRSEVFLRVVGPKPNGKLWPTLVKFTTSRVEVWIEQLATSDVQYYLLEGAAPGSSDLPGLFDREGFDP